VHAPCGQHGVNVFEELGVIQQGVDYAVPSAPLGGHIHEFARIALTADDHSVRSELSAYRIHVVTVHLRRLRDLVIVQRDVTASKNPQNLALTAFIWRHGCRDSAATR
jgi:hypothetical protein